MTLSEMNFLDPIGLLKLAWSRKALIAVCTLLGVLVAIGLAVTAKPIYLAYMTIGPKSSTLSGGGGGDMFSELGQLAGFSINSPGSSQVQMYRLLMTSTPVAEEAEKRYHLMPQYFPDAWNASEKRWKERSEINLGVAGNVKEALGWYHWSKPIPRDFAELVGARVGFQQLPKTQFYSVTYRCANPDEGLSFLRKLYEASNIVYNRGLASEIQAQINYIDNLLRTETRENVRTAQLRLLDSYSNRLISLHSGMSLLVDVIQPPTVQSSPIWPKRSLMVFYGAVLGFVGGLAVAVFLPFDLLRWLLHLRTDEGARMLRELRGRREM